MNKRKKIILQTLLIGTILNISLSNTMGQSVRRQSISAFGDSRHLNRVLWSQTAGQTYGTLTQTESNVMLLPGFQQTPVFSLQHKPSDPQTPVHINAWLDHRNSVIHILPSEEISHADIQVFSSDGVCLIKQSLRSFQSHQLDCSHLPDGFFLLQVSDDRNLHKSFKFILVH